MTLRESVEIEGVREANLGPRWEFAKIKLRAEPSSLFEVRKEVGPNQVKLDADGFLDAAVMGLLDVLLVAGQSPLKNVRITLLAAEEHEVDSSCNAFRMAGRDAGKKLMDVAFSQILKK
jgi:translation elongation factor EF-G